MKYKPYPKYKDSNVEWLGEIPEGWSEKRLRYAVSLNPSKNLIAEIPEVVSFLPMDLVGDDGIIDLSLVRSWEEVQQGYTFFQDGDVTYAIITPCFENGKGALMSGLANGIGFGTTELAVLRPKKDCVGKWLWYITVSQPFRENGKSFMYGAGGQKRVPDDFTRNYLCPFPSLSTQQSIAAFLDSETGKIDGLVKDYEELIVLLHEKRQALISHAVTRGLSELVNPTDPDFAQYSTPVTFNPSGVEWLGDIPEGWDVVPLKFITRMQSGDFIDAAEIHEEGIYPVMGGNGLRGYADNFNTEGDYPLIGRQGALCGNVNLSTGKFRATEHAIVCYTFSSTNHIWLYWNLQNMNLGQYSMTAAQPGLSVDVIKNIRSPFPAVLVQEAIALFLSRETSKIDSLIKETEEAIGLLKEHRSALITSAVTGKINVEGI